MKMAVQQFYGFYGFFWQLEVKIGKSLGGEKKKAYFCRKEAKVDQRSPRSMERGDL